jgi:hypothetical protein
MVHLEHARDHVKAFAANDWKRIAARFDIRSPST